MNTKNEQAAPLPRNAAPKSLTTLLVHLFSMSVNCLLQFRVVRLVVLRGLLASLEEQIDLDRFDNKLSLMVAAAQQLLDLEVEA